MRAEVLAPRSMWEVAKAIGHQADPAECPVAAGASTTVGIAQQGALLPKPSNKAPSSSQVPQEDSDEKIIHLNGSARRTACSGIQIVKV